MRVSHEVIAEHVSKTNTPELWTRSLLVCRYFRAWSKVVNPNCIFPGLSVPTGLQQLSAWKLQN